VLAQTQSIQAIEPLEMLYNGTIFHAEPIAQRVLRLERLLHLPDMPNASMDYRLARLQQAYQAGAADPEAQGKAIDAYNLGVEQGANGDLNGAIASYRQAIEYQPSMIQAYNNLAAIYEQIARYDEALETYQHALDVAPQIPMLYRNIGVVYQKKGKVCEALTAFEHYMSLTTEPDPTIASIVQEFRSRLKNRSNTQDYVAEATTGSNGLRLLWPESLRPIPVYVELQTPDQATFLPLVRDGWEAWTKATDGRLVFREVSRPEQAKIRIYLLRKPIVNPYSNVGHAQYHVDDALDDLRSLTVKITVDTGLPDDAIPMDYKREQVRRLVVHEMGHAIGLWGHSNDPADVMHTHPIVSDLSPRDIRTVKMLYSVH
jgi:tetratricopeptide (TPR) repeat protein